MEMDLPESISVLRSLLLGRYTNLAVPSLIGPDVVINGSLQSDGDVYLMGKIEGKACCRRLFLTREATVGECPPTTEIIRVADKA